jgi:hypothetical protein
MTKAKSFLERVREQREKRIAANKAAAAGEKQSILLIENLAKGSKTWWTKEPTEIRFRVLPFMVSKEDNIGDDQVGDLVTVRKYAVHFIGEKAYICPSTYGKPCPICDKYNTYSAEEKKSKNSPATRFKPKKYAMFNALMELADESGKVKTVMRVINAGYFATWQQILDSVQQTAETNKKHTDKINAFDDPEIGCWLEARCTKAAIAGGGDSAKFMQFTTVDVRWKEETKPLNEKVFDVITDLDLLIPEPASAETLRRAIGEDEPMPEPEAIEAEEEAEVDLTADTDSLDDEEVEVEEVKPAKAVKKTAKKKEVEPEEIPVTEETEDEDEIVEDTEIEGESEHDSDSDDGFGDDDFDDL